MINLIAKPLLMKESGHLLQVCSQVSFTCGHVNGDVEGHNIASASGNEMYFQNLLKCNKIQVRSFAHLDKANNI